MNLYTELHNRIKQIAEPLVNTITRGNFDDIDISKANIYPLLHMFVVSAQANNSQTITFTIQLGCFQQRNNNNTYENDKFYGNDNEVDNMNETLAVLLTIWTTLEMDFMRNDITASSDPNIDPVENGYGNGLDGWILNFDVELPLTKLSLCE